MKRVKSSETVTYFEGICLTFTLVRIVGTEEKRKYSYEASGETDMIRMRWVK